MVSLRALESLVAVADHGSITRAAEALHSSQPAVSQQLAALERETHTQLFLREGRGVRLTPAGRAALSDARRALDAAAAAVRSARAVGKAPADRYGSPARRVSRSHSLPQRSNDGSNATAP